MLRWGSRRVMSETGKAIKGLIVMSLDLDKMYTSFLNNAVPDVWSVVSFASRKSLLSWVKDMLFRVQFCRTWLYEGQYVSSFHALLSIVVLLSRLSSFVSSAGASASHSLPRL